MKPIVITQFKENHETLDFTWKWIQEIWEKDLKTFHVKFDNRDIKVHFPKPKVIGDGKLFLNLMNLKQAYCYICGITCEKAQNIKNLNENVTERNLEEMNDLIERLMEKWNKAKRSKKKAKDFLSFFTAAERKFICGWPTLKKNGFDFKNVPTMHFKAPSTHYVRF